MDELRDALADVLGGAVTGLRRLSGGASRETFSFELDGRGLILQRVRPGLVGGVAMEAEARLLRAARRAGVPVAEVVAASDTVSDVGAAFVVVERLPGETIARRILRDDEYGQARARLVAQCGRALAAVHSIRTDQVTGLRQSDQVADLMGLLDVLGEPHPAFELGFRWLGANRPDAVEPRVVHGDFRLGNLLVDREGLVAVLDWELAHLGDPLADLGWFTIRAWRFGARPEVAGLGSIDELIEAYEGAGGMPVDRDALLWWQVLGTLRWGIICVLQSSTHLSGASRSVELAAIGRRVCETEYDLLRLLP